MHVSNVVSPQRDGSHDELKKGFCVMPVVIPNHDVDVSEKSEHREELSDGENDTDGQSTIHADRVVELPPVLDT